MTHTGSTASCPRAFTHGAKSAANTFGCCRATACPWGRITVSTLVTAQPDDGEIRRLYDAINSEKVLAEFDPEAGEWCHCEGVALSQYDQLVHDWLDRVLVS